MGGKGHSVQGEIGRGGENRWGQCTGWGTYEGTDIYSIFSLIYWGSVRCGQSNAGCQGLACSPRLAPGGV